MRTGGSVTTAGILDCSLPTMSNWTLKFCNASERRTAEKEGAIVYEVGSVCGGWELKSEEIHYHCLILLAMGSSSQYSSIIYQLVVCCFGSSSMLPTQQSLFLYKPAGWIFSGKHFKRRRVLTPWACGRSHLLPQNACFHNNGSFFLSQCVQWYSFIFLCVIEVRVDSQKRWKITTKCQPMMPREQGSTAWVTLPD